jgi:hypothetical protein
MVYSMPHPTVPRRTLLSYAAPYWATRHPTELSERRNPTELRRNPTELRRTLLNYTAPQLVTPHSTIWLQVSNSGRFENLKAIFYITSTGIWFTHSKGTTFAKKLNFFVHSVNFWEIMMEIIADFHAILHVREISFSWKIQEFAFLFPTDLYVNT